MRRAKAANLALNILVHSKLRTWLTVTGIVIGVAAVVAIISIGEGLQASVGSRLGGLGADIITITPGGGGASSGFRAFGGGMEFGSGSTQNLTENDLKGMSSVDNVKAIEGEVSGRGQAYYLGENARFSIKGVDPNQWKKITNDQLESGRMLSSSDYNAIVIGYRLAKQTFKEPLALNRMVEINNKSFKVVGILQQSGGFGGDDNSAIMPIKAATDLLGLDPEDFSSITVKSSGSGTVDQVMADIDSKLMMLHHLTNSERKDYTIMSAASVQESINSITASLTLFLGAIAAVSLLVGGIGIANSMFTSVMEKTREIGIMKAIGAKNSDILSIFVLSSGMMGAVGGLIGIAAGVLISLALPALGISGFGSIPGIGTTGRGATAAGGFTTSISPQLLAGALILAMAIGIISGLIPSYRASKLKPVDALRYE